MKQPAWQCDSCRGWTPHGKYMCRACNAAQPKNPPFDLVEFGNGPKDKPRIVKPDEVRREQNNAELIKARNEFRVVGGGGLGVLYDDVDDSLEEVD